MTNDYERYNFWHSELDKFIEDEKKEKGLPVMPVEELSITVDPFPQSTWSTDFYLDGSINRHHNIFGEIELKKDLK